MGDQAVYPITLPKQFPENLFLTESGQFGSLHRQHQCPCCSSVLLRHVCSGRLFWRCMYCREDMPALPFKD